MLEVACSRCERHGRLSLAKLLHYPVLSDRLQFPCFGPPRGVPGSRLPQRAAPLKPELSSSRACPSRGRRYSQSAANSAAVITRPAIAPQAITPTKIMTMPRTNASVIMFHQLVCPRARSKWRRRGRPGEFGCRCPVRSLIRSAEPRPEPVPRTGEARPAGSATGAVAAAEAMGEQHDRAAEAGKAS